MSFPITNANPNAPVVTCATGSPTFVTTPVIQWTFSDPDSGDVQAHYRVVIQNSVPATVYDSGELSGAANSLTVPGPSALSPGTYTVSVYVWDEDGAESAAGTMTLVIAAVSGNTPPNAPTLTIVGGTPTANTQPEFTISASDSDAGDSCTGYVAWITRDSDGQVMWGSATTVVPHIAALGVPFNVTTNVTLGNGAFTFHAKTVDTSAAVGTAAMLAFVESPAADTTPPTISIASPASAATVSGQVQVIVNASDNVAVANVGLKIDGVTLADGSGNPIVLAAPNWPPSLPSQYSFTWDTSEWSNGNRVITATATDTSGNQASASVTVNLQNSLINLTQQLVFVQMPTAAQAPYWALNAQDFYNCLISMPIASVDPNSFSNYRIVPYINVPGTSTNLADYQVLTPGHFQSILTAGQSFRVILQFVPLGVQSSFSTGAASIARLTSYNPSGTALIGALALSPNKIWSFNGTALSVAVDLSTFANYNPVDLCYFDSKWYVPMAPAEGAPSTAVPIIRVVDQLAGALSYNLQVDPDPTYQPTCCAIFGGNLYIGLDNGSGAGKIYAIAPGDHVTLVSSSVPGIARLYAATDGSALWAGTSNGKVYGVTASSATLLYNSGQAAITSMLLDSGIDYFGTGNNGQLFTNRAGSFGFEDAFAGFTKILALGSYSGSVYASGDGSAIWQRLSGQWTNSANLSGVSSINDMTSYMNSLLIATTSTGGLLYRREIAQATGGIIARKLTGIGVLTQAM